MPEPVKRKLIEVALPLEAINREASREKSIRHGHPSTLHLWWARRPLAAARAVLFAQLVDDPSSRPDDFPTEEAQRVERERLHRLIERLVVWENTRDKELLREAHEEILKSTDGNPPPIVDPFAGGGTIPLEAQRLGLEAHASDLNPVAVLINKALIEIPPKFADQPPVFPELAESQVRTWRGAEGLAADVRAYGEWMRDEAERRIGHLYPKATLPDGTEANVIAWIWARTVTCPNPACGIEMPLVRSWWLGKKKGKEAYVVPVVVDDPAHPSGRRVDFTIGHDPKTAPTADNDGTVGRTGANCVSCQSAVPLTYVRSEGKSGRLGQSMMAIVAEGNRARVYLSPHPEHVELASDVGDFAPPPGAIPAAAPSFRVQAYGMRSYSDLFTARQLAALTTFSDLVSEARARAQSDANEVLGAKGVSESGALGSSERYADAVATYLAFAVSRTTNKFSSICGWDSSVKMEGVRGVFARQAIPMVWDFAEANPFGAAAGDSANEIEWVVKVLDGIPAQGYGGAVVEQVDASQRIFTPRLVSTDPPYYDNIGYSDLSDFFYVWLRRSLKDVYPELFGTMLVPKAEELVANPYRHGGKDGAKEFFEEGFRQVFKNARREALPDFPITVYYAFKQSEANADGTASTGWETLLDGMVGNGWAITATWPMRSELGNRMIASGTNALASSIVLALRPRPEGAPTTDRRGFIAAMRSELPQALRDLQQGAIAPVDLPQAAIGPGMAIFSRYSQVIESDGEPMTVRSALQRINEVLDEVLSEQEGDFDSPTRFAIAWYRQHGYATGTFGDADNLARARNTSVDGLRNDGVLSSHAGKVALIKPAELDTSYDPETDARISVWEVTQHLIRLLESDGIPAAGRLLALVQSLPGEHVEPDLIKELAFLLFSVAEKNGWGKDAQSFNALATTWQDIVDAARTAPTTSPNQTVLDLDQ